VVLPRARLTIRGPHTNVRRGPFLTRLARIFSGRALFSLVCKAKQRSKNLAVDRELRGPSHDTIGTIVNPALVLPTSLNL